ncbi:MAG TPA: GGDEF domain-containing protein [Longimicrobiaceae bacterium]|jgi:diguanylate cyclase (GGDEF)-like protein|nr:GGDEF domain-containing protein [Longimicrobiaceae bacterium]
MMLRRLDDRDLKLVLAAPPEWLGEGAEGAPEWIPAKAARSPAGAEAGAAERVPAVMFVADVAADNTARVANGSVVAGAGPAAWREEALRTARRRELPDKLLRFFEELNLAEGEAEVYRAVAVNAVRIVGAHTGLVLVRDTCAPGHLRVAGGSAGAVREAMVPRLERFGKPGLICAVQARSGGHDSPIAELAPLAGDRATSTLAHVPFGDGGVLMLTERRDERVFEGEDWDMLRALALQGEMALRRVRLLESVRSLALTDPLTGLANRRQMDVVMGYAWAAAQRGEGLAVIVIDLDDFKAVNDRRGHLVGDELLRAVAEALRAEARGSDTVVRYGGDEFLVILPGGDAPGARALMRRVRARLDGRAELSHGIAVHTPAHSCAEELIRDADRRLYDNKAARAASAPILGG